VGKWLVVFLFLSSCSGLPLGLLTGGGGTNAAANVQAGKTNNQTVGMSEQTSQEIKVETVQGTIQQSKDSNSVRTERVENLTINQIPVWVILLLLLGWLLPTPTQMVKEVMQWIGFARHKQKYR
jgi:hypothetical protein